MDSIIGDSVPKETTTPSDLGVVVETLRVLAATATLTHAVSQ